MQKVLLKSAKKPKPWVKRVKEPDSVQDFGQLFDQRGNTWRNEKFTLIVMIRISVS